MQRAECEAVASIRKDNMLESGEIHIFIRGGVVIDVMWADDTKHVVVITHDHDDAEDDPQYEPNEWISA